jgi:hypothetical protein
MTKIQLERLKRLRKYWMNIDPKTVDLDNWKCSSYACLLGHACQFHEFNKQGLGLQEENENLPIYINQETSNESFGFNAGSAFFGCDTDVFDHISDNEERSGLNHWQIALNRLDDAIAEGEESLQTY